MLGIPDQTEKSISDFLTFCHENNIPHISTYLLKLEEGTRFYKMKSDLNLPTEDESAELYMYVCDILRNFGYNHYEISNFSYPGFESRHNLKYWNLDEYLGIGPSAHSLADNKRFYYPDNLDDFIYNPQILSEGEFEPEKEYAMLRLRLATGLERNSYKNKLDKDIPEPYFKKAREYADSGFVTVNNSGLRLTEKGFLVSNGIISDILL
jgi:oxygen-independent coproporphyrinogen-3 oxidase